MRRVSIVVVCLCGLALAQGRYTGGATWIGSGIWGAGFPSGSELSDLPLPDFTSQGGVMLSLPQAWVDPMEAFNQTIDNLVYIGNTSNGCPNAPARTNYLGQTKSAGQCDFYDSNGAGLTQVANDWATLSGGSYDQRWDVVITHGTAYNFGNSAWIWPAKYNGTHATKYLLFHSDCTALSPCTGTNDLGYNPLGRTVCSHGINDFGLTPPLPDAGQRNHGCQGYLGFPGVDAPVPITNAAYSYDSNYNDLANMFTLSSTVNIGVSNIDMASASTLGGGAGCTGPCPTEGVNHIWLTDGHFVTGQSPTNNGRTNTPVNFAAQEWTALLPSGYLPAAPDHVGLSQVYIDGSTDDDGFGTQKIQRAIVLSCAYCAITHSYIDGNKSDGKENHGISTTDAPGPVMIVHDWCESSSGCYWGGGGGFEAIQDHRAQNIEFRRNRLTYNPRWVEAPAGNQTIKKNIASGGGGSTCTGGNTLDIKISNSNAITNSVVYLKGITGSGVADGWYTASTVNSTDIIISTACTGNPTAGSVYGWADNYLGAVNVTAAAMNAAGKDPTMNNPVLKNGWEAKEYAQVLGDGFICENSAVGSQNGQCMSVNTISYSGSAPDNGGQFTQVHDVTTTNFIVRHSTEGFNYKSRSGGASLGTYTVTNISCNGLTSATVVATGLNAGLTNPASYLADFTDNCSANGHTPCTGTSYGSDVYLTGVSGGLIPDGWYTTSYPTNGSYANDANVTIWADQNHVGQVCTVNNGTASSGTVYGMKGSNGDGVSWPGHRIVYQNGLVYGIGDHNLSNGSTVQLGQSGGAGNNYTAQSTVNADGVTATATMLHIDVCAASDMCPRVLQAAPGDLAYMICTDSRFNAIDGANGNKGTPMLSVSGDQLSFSYVLNAANHNQLHAGDTTTCPMAPPTSSTQSGYYNYQSSPWPFFVNHVTGIGINGFKWNMGDFQYNATFQNSLQLVPGPADVYASDSGSGGTNTNLKYGMVGNATEGYYADDSKGLTYGADRNTLSMRSWAVSTRNIHDYLTFPCGTPPSSGCDTSGNPAIAGTNSTPINVASIGSTVTCSGGHPCNSTYYTPDSVGFVGSMNTNNYPFLLADWRNYGLHTSSPYKAGGILQAIDGLDNGVQVPLLVNALSRTMYVCPKDTSGNQISCGSGPYRDGPQYGFLYWSAYGGAVNYRIYRDGTNLVGTTTNLWFDDYGLPTGTHAWTVKAWDGTAEHAVAGLSGQIF